MAALLLKDQCAEKEFTETERRFWLKTRTDSLAVELRTHLERDSARSQVLPLPVQVRTTLGFPDRGSLQVWTQPVDTEPSCSICVGRNDPTVSHVYQACLYTKAGLPNIKAPLAASFSNVTLLQRNHRKLYLSMWTETFSLLQSLDQLGCTNTINHYGWKVALINTIHSFRPTWSTS